MKKHQKGIIIGTLCLIVFIAMFVYSILSERVKMNTAGTVGNTAGNANNGGLFCEYNGIVYFANPYDGGALYSMTPQETNLKKLSSSQVEHLNAGGSYVYYFQKGLSGKSGLGYVRSPYGVYRTDLKGKKAVCLYQGIVRNLQLVDNYIFYLTAGEKNLEFIRQKIDRSDSTVLTKDGINPACASDSSLYYNGMDSNHYLYRMDASTGSVSTIWEGNLFNPALYGGYMYFLDVSDNYCLSRYSMSDNVVEKLTKDRVDTFNIGGGYIYYQRNSQTSPALIKMNADGSQPEIVAEGNYTNINMTSQYVYFQKFGNDMDMYRMPIGGKDYANFEGAREAALTSVK